MSVPWRLLIDPPAAGVWNMAVDEALLEGMTAADAVPVLRWYQWREPTLSLGYFQTWHDVPGNLAALPRVRRLSGGGAILHDDEWTYSLALPKGRWPRKTHVELVADVHAAAAAVLAEIYFELPPCETAAPRKEVPHGEPTLCFARRSAGDLLCGGHKIMGSASHGRAGALLQHGSLALPDEPRSPTLPARWSELPQRIAGKLAAEWNLAFHADALRNDERERAERLAAERYAHPAWNEKR